MKKLIATIFLLFSTVSFSDAYNYWSFGYQDVEEFDGAKGEVSAGEADGFFGHYRGYALSAEGMSVDIHLVGGGKSWAGDNADFSIEGGYAQADSWVGVCMGSRCLTDDWSNSGYYLEAAVRGGDPEGVSYKLTAGTIDVEESLSFFTFDLNYSFNENWGATIGMISLDGDSGPNLSIRRNF